MRTHLAGAQSEKELAPLIGHRVSIRLHDDGGGYRDILGYLESSNSVKKKDGAIAEFDPKKIATLRVVIDAEFRAGAGAPLSMRIRDLEIAAAKTWPSDSLELFGQWQIRISKGFSYRANSVLPLGAPPFGDPPLEISEAVNYVVSKYLEHKLDPVFHVTLPIHQELDRYLSEKGWESPYEILVMVGDTRELTLEEAHGEIINDKQLSDSWLNLQGDHTVNEILERYPSQFLQLLINEETVSVGRLSIADGWGILTRIFVGEVHRNKGYGEEIISAMARAAENLECNKLALQVNSDNLAAIKLYEKMGFKVHHTYRYRKLLENKNVAECC